jgi:hypothetical protein
MVCGGGNGVVWDCGTESYIENERIEVRRVKGERVEF